MFWEEVAVGHARPVLLQRRLPVQLGEAHPRASRPFNGRSAAA